MDYEKDIRQWCEDRSNSPNDNVFVRKLRAFLTPEQIVSVLIAIEETCSSCWDGDNHCQCWNDE